MRQLGGTPSSGWLPVVIVLALLLVCLAILGLCVSRGGWAPNDDSLGLPGTAAAHAALDE